MAKISASESVETQKPDINMIGERTQLEKGFTTNERLGKRLTYLLRYGAEKEGLEVSSSGRCRLSFKIKIWNNDSL